MSQHNPLDDADGFHANLYILFATFSKTPPNRTTLHTSIAAWTSINAYVTRQVSNCQNSLISELSGCLGEGLGLCPSYYTAWLHRHQLNNRNNPRQLKEKVQVQAPWFQKRNGFSFGALHPLSFLCASLLSCISAIHEPASSAVWTKYVFLSILQEKCLYFLSMLLYIEV